MDIEKTTLEVNKKTFLILRKQEQQTHIVWEFLTLSKLLAFDHLKETLLNTIILNLRLISKK